MTVKATPKNKVYKVYAPNETIAINVFTSMCDRYKLSKNDGNKEHWQQQKDAIIDNDFTMIYMEDFCGVREVI